MPLDEFITGTMEALATEATEIMVPRAKFLREQAGATEEVFVTGFNEQLEAPPA